MKKAKYDLYIISLYCSFSILNAEACHICKKKIKMKYNFVKYNQRYRQQTCCKRKKYIEKAQATNAQLEVRKKSKIIKLFGCKLGRVCY